VTVQNVVTYDVVVQVSNADLKLKPGMTANVSIITSRKQGVLLVPNSALRFKPQEKGGEATGQSKRTSDIKGPAVWILENKQPKQRGVATGISDGSFTEIVSKDLREGQEIIVATLGQNEQKQTARTPRFFH
jgi:HlyD family secretion protein